MSVAQAEKLTFFLLFMQSTRVNMVSMTQKHLTARRAQGFVLQVLQITLVLSLAQP